MSAVAAGDAYAPIYDAIGQGRRVARMAGWVVRWLCARGLRRGCALDLACATGAAALTFVRAGWQVVGVDRSAAMLQIARGRARDAGCDVLFVQANIHDLGTIGDARESPSIAEHLPANAGGGWSFDLVTCFDAGLNELTADGDLDRAFGGIADRLRPGGYLICELNTEVEYRTWDERDRVIYDGQDCLVYHKLSYDVRAHLGHRRVVWFVREIELWWRGEEMRIERAWRDTEVCAALERAGLALVGRWNAEGAEVVEGAGELPQVVYIAQKPHAEKASYRPGAPGGGAW
jgi:SAM-dependent methyltransferase